MVGVELEGGFSKEMYVKHTRETELWHHDGSVSAGEFSGEVISKPYADIRALSRWIKENYPIKVNETCGFHIHISTKSNLDYMRLMSKAFHRHFLKMWTRWGEKHVSKDNRAFWWRLQNKTLPGRSQNYCARDFPDVDGQVSGRGNRYHQLNFCWRKHQTMENRLLPMFENPSLGCQAVKYYVEFVDRWLSIQPRLTLDNIEDTVTGEACIVDDEQFVEQIPVSDQETLEEVVCV